MAPVFSVLAEAAVDSSNQEQVLTTARRAHSKTSQIREELLDFALCDKDTSGAAPAAID